MPDPNVTEAIAEIISILEKRDLAGICVISSPTHCHYLNKVDPTWSCARFELNPDGRLALRIKASAKDNGGPEGRNKIMADTAGFFLGSIDVLNLQIENCQSAVRMIAKNVQSMDHWTREEET